MCTYIDRRLLKQSSRGNLPYLSVASRDTDVTVSSTSLEIMATHKMLVVLSLDIDLTNRMICLASHKTRGYLGDPRYVHMCVNMSICG